MKAMFLATLIRAGRSLRRRPGSSAAVVLTLGLGIAVSTAVFTLAEAVLFRKLPYRDADRIVALQNRTGEGQAAGISWQDARDLAAARSFDVTAVYSKRTWALSDSTGQPLEVVLSGMVTQGFFTALGVEPEWGEPFVARYEHPGGNRVVWLSHALWQRRYNGQPQAARSYLSLNSVSYRIAGVLPAWFRFPIDGENPDLYLPLDETAYCCARNARETGGLARIAPGVPSGKARAELRVLSARLGQAHPETNRSVRFEAVNLQEAL
ncbi:MAG TPA: ABC transporter permease, partial [Bryobacteraceae bacterium]|nr:ABC transporter permease [Bryobacteraceae bacterium]